MSRSLKFRAFQPRPSLHRAPGMYDVSDIVWYDKADDEGHTGEVFFKGHTSSEYIEDVELLQYIGREDSKGVSIFEGDVVEFDSPPSIDYWASKTRGIGVVVWSKHEARYILRPGAEWPEPHTTGSGFMWSNKTWVVIGNVHESPELLGQSA